MTQDYHPGQRDVQDRFDSRRLADRLAESTSATISEPHRAFIEARDMFFIATADPDGRPQVSYKGGEPGVVRVLDERTLAFPAYNGNGMFLTAGNLVANPHVAMLFIDFSVGTRLRLTGDAVVGFDDELVTTWPGAEFLIRVTTREVFANCRRYVHRYERVERSAFVPSGTAPPPVPDWKLDPWFEGTLPTGDPARHPGTPSAPSVPQF